MTGFVKLHRKLLENPIFYKPELLQLFVYCLLRANHKDNEFVFNDDMQTVKRGTFITGRKILSSDLKCKESTVYKRLLFLQKLGYIRIDSNNKFSIVTVINYEKYQNINHIIELKSQKMEKSNNKKDFKIIDNIEVKETEIKNSNNKVTTKEQQNNTNKNDKNDKNNNYKILVVLLYCKLLKVNPDSSHYGFIGRLIGQERDKLTYLQKCLLLCYTLRSLQDKFNNAKIKGIIINTYKETSYSVIKNLTGTREHPNLSYKTETTFTYKHNNLPY